MNVNKAAMDSAIKAARAGATKDTMQLMRDISEAERIVRPFIGDLAIAQDSAAAVYKLALEKNGINLDGVHPSAYKAMVAMLPQPGTQPAQVATIAQDTGVIVSFNKRFPDASRVRNLG